MDPGHGPVVVSNLVYCQSVNCFYNRETGELPSQIMDIFNQMRFYIPYSLDYNL